MGMHTSLFFSDTVEPSSTSMLLNLIPAATDQVLAFRNNAHVPSQPMSLIALAATGGGAADTLTMARVQSPKTVVSPAYIRPLNSDDNAVFPDNPSVSTFPTTSIVLRKGEEVSAYAAVTGSSTSAIVCIAMFLCDQLDPLPSGESYWVAFQANVQALQGERWQSFPISFVDSTTLPAGRYAVIGMHLAQPRTSAGTSTANVLCGRLIIPGQPLRPGTLVSPDASSRTPDFASNGSFGTWGIFDAQVPPSIELFSQANAGANETLSGFLKVVQLP